MKKNIMTKTYAIVSNGRSRSTLLRYNLTSIGVAGTPQQLGLRNVDLTEKGFLEFLETCRVENVARVFSKIRGTAFHISVLR